MEKGFLILETGDIFEGTLIGTHASTEGEVVFNTSMTGYQEILTDPSYKGQIMTFCYPLIGNYGVNAQDCESTRIHMQGAIISNLCQMPSHYQSIKTLDEWMKQSGVTGLTGVDTRALVKKIRKGGTMKAVITSSPESYRTHDWSKPLPQDVVKEVSAKVVKTYEGHGPHVVLIDYGYKKSMLTALLDAGCRVTVVPYNVTFRTIESLHPDGVMLSNGPGDPLQLHDLFAEVRRITSHYPSLGICLGHQVIALAYGAKTGKLLFGHRGGNHPVKETLTGKVWITSQNHSYVVEESSVDDTVFTVTYRNVNDGSVEGLKHNTFPIETVQFHPEAHPGPDDTHLVFNRFIDTIKQSKGEMTNAVTY